MYDALVNGLGIARLLTVQGMHEGLLVKLEDIFGKETVTERNVLALYPRARNLPQKTKVFLDYLRASLAISQAATFSKLEK